MVNSNRIRGARSSRCFAPGRCCAAPPSGRSCFRGKAVSSSLLRPLVTYAAATWSNRAQRDPAAAYVTNGRARPRAFPPPGLVVDNAPKATQVGPNTPGQTSLHSAAAGPNRSMLDLLHPIEIGQLFLDPGQVFPQLDLLFQQHLAALQRVDELVPRSAHFQELALAHARPHRPQRRGQLSIGLLFFE